MMDNQSNPNSQSLDTPEEPQDPIPGPDDAEPDEAPSEATPELGEVAKERDEYLELAKRQQAEFENYRKRTRRELDQASQKAKAQLLRDFLPTLDSLDKALEVEDAKLEDLKAGVELTHQALHNLLEKNRVEVIDPLGEDFDPHFHEAVASNHEEGTEGGKVIEVIQKGYRQEEALLRPALVIVSV